MFLFSCIPVCLLPLLHRPSPLPQFPNPISSSSLSSVQSLFSPSTTSPPSLGSSSSFPTELYSVADIFPASLDKNKFCCFVWSPANAFVSVTSFCLGYRCLFFVTVKAHMHLPKQKKKKKKRGREWIRMRNKQEKEKMLCNVFFFVPC